MFLPKFVRRNRTAISQSTTESRSSVTCIVVIAGLFGETMEHSLSCSGIYPISADEDICFSCGVIGEMKCDCRTIVFSVDSVIYKGLGSVDSTILRKFGLENFEQSRSVKAQRSICSC